HLFWYGRFLGEGEEQPPCHHQKSWLCRILPTNGIGQSGHMSEKKTTWRAQAGNDPNPISDTHYPPIVPRKITTESKPRGSLRIGGAQTSVRWPSVNERATSVPQAPRA